MGRSTIIRIRLITAGLCLFALLLVVRLYMVQIVQGEEFSSLADRQYVQSAYGMYDRGTVFFEDKDGRLVAGATLQSGFTATIVPASIREPQQTYETLEKVIPIDREAFFASVEKKDDPYEEIAQRLLPDQAKVLEEAELSGVHLYKQRWRYYPGKQLAAHTIGFVGYQGDTVTGLYGIERYWNDVLSRKESSKRVNFFAELFGNISETLLASERQKAGDIVTSIEPSVQKYVEEVVRSVSDTWGSRRTGAIVMDPKTGSIYAFAATPSFDANNFKIEKDVSAFSNPLVENVYEMGSIIKPISMAIGLDTGAVTPETTYNDSGCIVLDKYRVCNFDGKARGVVPMQEVLSQSLNTGVSFVAAKVGKEKFGQRMRAFKLGEETGIDLPNEAHGLVDNLSSPRMIEYSNASFGQGIAMTPIETVRALAALGNGGFLVTPHIAKKIQYETGASKDVAFDNKTRVISQKTSEEITHMLVTVVDKALLGGAISLPHHSIAAKTGTAQIAQAGARGYYDDRYLHSFFGYFPAYDPHFIVFLYTVEPKGVKYASETLTQPFSEITKFLINYYEIPPDR